jgi:hypothetical protein
MTLMDNDEYIAERVWAYLSDSGVALPVKVVFTKPRQGGRGPLWEAKFSLIWPDKVRIERRVFGTDSVDALIQIVELFRIESGKLRDEFGDKITFEGTKSLFGYEGVLNQRKI